MMRNLIFIITLSFMSIALLAQDGSSCATPLLVTCNKYMHIDHLFQGTLTDNGAMPCVDDFQEVAGIWLELKIGRSGQLAFDLVPDDPDQDLDFTLFRGKNCRTLEAVRCVGGGRSADGHSGCMGATGLRADEVDYFEMVGCPEGQNNYARSIFMEAGEEFLLYVHAFQGEGGFGISFAESVILSSVPVQQAVQTSWDGEAHSVSLALEEPVEQAIWTFPGSEPGHAIGSGPHLVRPVKSITLPWQVEIVLNEDCICDLQKGEVEPQLQEGKLKVWPNPARDWVSITISSFYGGEHSLDVRLISGALVAQIPLSEKNTVIELSEYGLGVGEYVLTCNNSSVVLIVK